MCTLGIRAIRPTDRRLGLAPRGMVLCVPSSQWIETPTPIPREHVYAVGLVALRAAEMEGTLATVTGHLINPSGPGFILSLGQGFEANRITAVALAEAGSTTRDLTARLKSVLEKCAASYAKRNQVIPGFWMATHTATADAPEHEAIRVKRWGKGDRGTWSAQGLLELARDIENHCAELSQLAHEIRRTPVV